MCRMALGDRCERIIWHPKWLQCLGVEDNAYQPGFLLSAWHWAPSKEEPKVCAQMDLGSYPPLCYLGHFCGQSWWSSWWESNCKGGLFELSRLNLNVRGTIPWAGAPDEIKMRRCSSWNTAIIFSVCFFTEEAVWPALLPSCFQGCSSSRCHVLATIHRPTWVKRNAFYFKLLWSDTLSQQ